MEVVHYVRVAVNGGEATFCKPISDGETVGAFISRVTGKPEGDISVKVGPDASRDKKTQADLQMPVGIIISEFGYKHFDVILQDKAEPSDNQSNPSAINVLSLLMNVSRDYTSMPEKR